MRPLWPAASSTAWKSSRSVVNSAAPRLNVSFARAAGSDAREHDRGAQIVDVEELVAIRALAEDREVAAFARPLVEEREHAEALGTDEGLGAKDGDLAALAARTPRRRARPRPSRCRTGRRRSSDRSRRAGGDRARRRQRSRRYGPRGGRPRPRGPCACRRRRSCGSRRADRAGRAAAACTTRSQPSIARSTSARWRMSPRTSVMRERSG